MFKGNLKNELIKARKELAKSYTIFYTDGSVRKQVVKDVHDRINDTTDQFFWIEEQFKAACSYYARRHELDGLNMGLTLGVIYNSEDVNDDQTIKEGKTPLYDKVHFYTEKIDSYLGDEKTNTEDFTKYHYQSQSFLDYSHLLSEAKKDGMVFDGPKSFNELVETIKSKQPCDINVYLGLEEEKPMTLKRK